MKLLNAIEGIRAKIRLANNAINRCSNTEAGRMIKEGLVTERNEMCYRLGMLVANSAVKICLQ